jgi:hypothetical protein
MELLKEMFTVFTRIATLTLIGSATFISIFWENAELSVIILWEILAVSVLCSLVTLLWRKEAKTKRQLLMRSIISYLYVNVVVMGCGYLFEWYYWEQIPMVLGMLLLILLITLAVSFIPYHKDKNLADKMNEKLQQRKKADHQS